MTRSTFQPEHRMALSVFCSRCSICAHCLRLTQWGLKDSNWPGSSSFYSGWCIPNFFDIEGA